MKLCFICNEYPPGPHGGVGTFVQTIARAFVDAGHQVSAVGVYPADYPAPDEERDQGVQVLRLRRPQHRFGWIRARYQLYRTLRRWSHAGEIDLVEVHDAGGWAAYWPRLGVPVVVRLNGSSSYFAAEAGRQPPRLTFLLERASLRRADRWCSVSTYTANKTKSLFRLPTVPHAILPNPVGMPSPQQVVPRERGQVVFTGTLVPKKGVVQLFRSWPAVLANCPAARLHIYGKDGVAPTGGSMKEYLLSLLEREQRGTVQFYDHVSRAELQQALAGARLSVFPSYAEAFAIAPMEAMLCGCPTIYSQRGSGPELMQDGRDGLLIDPDNVDQLAGAIVRLLEDDQLAQRLGEAGRQRVLESFTVGRAVTANEVFYRDTIDAFKTERSAVRLSSKPLAESRV